MNDELGLITLSRFNHLEGYLDFAIKKMMEKGIATFSNECPEKPIRVIYDQRKNPYFLINMNNFEKVKEEMKKRMIIPEGMLKSRDFFILRRGMGYIHNQIQQEYSSKLLRGIDCD